ncbi:hypothetical protein AVEN_198679-1, partial [Araneus ventricosus]
MTRSTPELVFLYPNVLTTPEVVPLAPKYDLRCKERRLLERTDFFLPGSGRGDETVQAVPVRHAVLFHPTGTVAVMVTGTETWCGVLSGRPSYVHPTGTVAVMVTGAETWCDVLSG